MCTVCRFASKFFKGAGFFTMEKRWGNIEGFTCKAAGVRGRTYIEAVFIFVPEFDGIFRKRECLQFQQSGNAMQDYKVRHYPVRGFK
ncbi:hypothetical protein AO726_15595 [Pseudomonas sp. TTU2014-080ASC]|nr:hypothetical protein AO726_15595 [Pseudomonas sp. TTU2014-080ASC]